MQCHAVKQMMKLPHLAPFRKSILGSRLLCLHLVSVVTGYKDFVRWYWCAVRTESIEPRSPGGSCCLLRLRFSQLCCFWLSEISLGHLRFPQRSEVVLFVPRDVKGGWAYELVCEGQRRASPVMKYWWRRLWFCNRYFWSRSVVAEEAPPPQPSTRPLPLATPPPRAFRCIGGRLAFFLLIKSRRVLPLIRCLHFRESNMEIRCVDGPLGPVPCWPSI